MPRPSIQCASHSSDLLNRLHVLAATGNFFRKEPAEKSEGGLKDKAGFPKRISSTSCTFCNMQQPRDTVFLRVDASGRVTFTGLAVNPCIHLVRAQSQCDRQPEL